MGRGGGGDVTLLEGVQAVVEGNFLSWAKCPGLEFSWMGYTLRASYLAIKLQVWHIM